MDSRPLSITSTTVQQRKGMRREANVLYDKPCAFTIYVLNLVDAGTSSPPKPTSTTVQQRSGTFFHLPDPRAIPASTSGVDPLYLDWCMGRYWPALNCASQSELCWLNPIRFGTYIVGRHFPWFPARYQSLTPSLEAHSTFQPQLPLFPASLPSRTRSHNQKSQSPPPQHLNVSFDSKGVKTLILRENVIIWSGNWVLIFFLFFFFSLERPRILMKWVHHRNSQMIVWMSILRKILVKYFRIRTLSSPSSASTMHNVYYRFSLILKAICFPLYAQCSSKHFYLEESPNT